MNDKIMFEIKNLGPINEAKLDLNKINVVVGKNSTGKSISSKFLYSILTAMSSEAFILSDMSIKDLCVNFFDEWSNNFELSTKDFLKIINFILYEEPIKPLDKEPIKYDIFVGEMKKIIEKSDFQNKDECLNQLNRINKLIIGSNDKSFKYQNVFNYLLSSELGESVYHDNTNITFFGSVNQKEFKQEISLLMNNGSTKISDDNFFKCLNFSNVIYIDSVSILDYRDKNKAPYHFNSLYKKLKDNNKNIYDDEFYNAENNFKNRIDQLIGGEFLFEDDEFLFKNDDFEISMNITSSGIKQLGIIQLLLANHQLKRNSFLIIDEPEVNLHPEWQIKFAEILVLMAKELDIKLYINTHSPFLAEAIEVYGLYYKFNNEINFYLTQKSNTRNKFDFKLIDESNIHEIYDNLGNPFDTLNNIRIKTDLNL